MVFSEHIEILLKIMETFKNLLSLLSSKEKKRAVLLLGMISVMTLLDTMGVASILPFMAVLTEPTIVEKNYILKTMFEFTKNFGVENKKDFLFLLGMLVFVILVTSLAFKALTIYAQLRFAKMREYSISKRLVEGYLHQPYIWFVGRHSADLGKSILSEVSTVVNGVMLPIIELISKSFIAIAILTLLILTDPKLAIIVGLTLSLFYGVILKLNHGFLKQIGKERLKANKSRFTAVSEAFGAAKEIKVGGLENNYVSRFSVPARIFAKHLATYKTLSQLPRFALEAIAFGGMLIAILYLMSKKGTFTSIIPVITLYAFAGYRLLPALQIIYASISQIRFNGPALDSLINDINGLNKYRSTYSNETIKLKKQIKLNHIYYDYPDASRAALKDININIPAQTIVGLVGETGSGKTTLVDIILGLLQAQRGTIKIDDKIIDKSNSREWQRSIGYVPQNIYLSDDTVAANIAFGVNSENINYEAVERAARISNLHDFVINELPKKYKTTIGERGVKLSGGQRQRIGIARALYYNPQILILDEATSALDNLTEKVVMDSINNLGKEITIILIAHRLETVKKCNIIFQLSQGRIIGQGNYESFINEDPNFNLGK